MSHMTLRGRSPSLATTYRRTLEGLNGLPSRNRTYAIRVLQFVLFAVTPPSLPTISDMMAVQWEPEPRLNDADRLPEALNEVLQLCSSLITVVPQSDDALASGPTVRLAHATVRSFLKSSECSNLVGDAFSADAAHLMIAKASIAYLLSIEYDPPRYMATISKFPFSRYAAFHLWDHLHVRLSLDASALNLLNRLFADNVAAFDFMAQSRSSIYHPADPMEAAIQFNLRSVLEHLLALHQADLQALLAYAIQYGRMGIAVTLVRRGADLDDLPLQLLVMEDHGNRLGNLISRLHTTEQPTEALSQQRSVRPTNESCGAMYQRLLSLTSLRREYSQIQYLLDNCQVRPSTKTLEELLQSRILAKASSSSTETIKGTYIPSLRLIGGLTWPSDPVKRAATLSYSRNFREQRLKLEAWCTKDTHDDGLEDHPDSSLQIINRLIDSGVTVSEQCWCDAVLLRCIEHMRSLRHGTMLSQVQPLIGIPSDKEDWTLDSVNNRGIRHVVWRLTQPSDAVGCTCSSSGLQVEYDPFALFLGKGFVPSTSALNLAILIGCHDMIQLLLSHHAPADSNSLRLALEGARHQLVKNFLEQGVRPSDSESFDYLSYAIEQSAWDIADQLLDVDVVPSPKAFLIAYKSGPASGHLASRMLEHDNFPGEATLDYAASERQWEVVGLLLERDIAPTTTALLHAWDYQRKLFKVMLEKSLVHGQQALTAAVETERWPLVWRLVEAGIKPAAEALLYAVQQHNADAAVSFIDRDPDLLYHENSRSILLLAIAQNMLAVVRLILGHDLGHALAKPEIMFARAILTNSTDMVKLLLQQGIDPNVAACKTPLCLATQVRQQSSIKTLLKHHADPNMTAPTQGQAVDMLSKDEVEEFAQVKDEGTPNIDNAATPLHVAVHNGDHAAARLLLKYGANPNEAADHQKPLFVAVHAGDQRMTKLLIDHGADPNVVYQSQTVLCSAIDAANHELVTLLLDCGADPDIASTKAPLELAWQRKDAEQMKLLLKHHARPDVSYSSDSLRWAVAEEDLKLVELLLPEGHIDVNVVDVLCNETVLDLAYRMESEAIGRVLLAYGAKTRTRLRDEVESWDDMLAMDSDEANEFDEEDEDV